jgi:Ca2+/Na+ antiporter
MEFLPRYFYYFVHIVWKKKNSKKFLLNFFFHRIFIWLPNPDGIFSHLGDRFTFWIYFIYHCFFYHKHKKAASVLFGKKKKKFQVENFFFQLLALFSFILSGAWLYIVGTEVVSLLRVSQKKFFFFFQRNFFFFYQTLGHILGLSEHLLGLTIVAWANSSIDLISNVVVAKQGFNGK